MIGFKGLNTGVSGIFSPMYPMRWEDSRARIEDVHEMRTDNLVGIHVTRSVAEALDYSPHVFIVRGYGKVMVHENGFRAEEAEIVAYLDLADEVPSIVRWMNIPVVEPKHLAEFDVDWISAGDSRIVDGDNVIIFGEEGHVFISEGEGMGNVKKIVVTRAVSRLTVFTPTTVHVAKNGYVGEIEHVCPTWDEYKIVVHGKADLIRALAARNEVEMAGASARSILIRGSLGRGGQAILNIMNSTVDKIYIDNSTVDYIAIGGSKIGSLHMRLCTATDIDIHRSVADQITLDCAAVEALYVSESSEVGTLKMRCASVLNLHDPNSRIGRKEIKKGDL